MAFNLLGFVLAGLYWFASGRDGAEARWWERLLNGWIAGAAFCSLVAIVDFAAFFAGAREGLIGSFQPHVMFFSEHGLPRPQAFSYEPSYLALAICFALPTLMIRLLKARREQWRTAAANGLALAIMAVAQVLIFSRTGLALFGIEIALVFCFFFFGASHRRKLLLAGACAVVAAGAFALIPAEQRRSIQSMFVTSLLEKRDFSANSRAAHFVGGLKLAARDWIGTGAGSAMWRWQNAYEGRLEVTHPQQATPLMSLWPEILVEQGAAGLALAAAFLATLGWRLGRNPSAEARGVFIAYAPVVVFALLLMPTFTRADLWSLIAMSGIFAAPASQAREAAVARDV